MNCELVQRQLLASDSPGEPSAETRRHLAECPACRAWQQQLAQLEQQLPLLATPPSSRKNEVVRSIVDAVEAFPANGTALPYAPILPFAKPPPRERALRKASLAIAMAAGLAVFALGWWAWQHPPTSKPTPTPQLQAFRDERNRQLEQAPSKRAKVEVLVKLADQRHQEALTLAQEDDADKLATTAQFYIELVRDDLPSYAKDLPIAQRPAVLPTVALQLQDTESSITRFLASSANLTDKARRDLKQMADETRKSQIHVQAILGGEV